MALGDGKFRSVVCGAILLNALVQHPALLLSQNSDSSRLGNVKTIVLDPNGAVIPNAEVRFKGEKVVTSSTEEDGSVQVQLPYGTYSITITKPGFRPTTIDSFAVQAASPPELEVVLRIRPYCDDCFVEGLGPQVTTSVLTSVIEAVRVPDAATALRIAEPALIRVYGKQQINYEKPLTAVLENGIWSVYGTLCCPDRKGRRTCEVGRCLGGVATLKLRQNDGKVLAIYHTK